MPAINFPTNPSTNDTYTLGNKTWKFNGSAWDLQPLTAGYTGSQGNIGYTGSKGDTGFVGSKGDTGYTGSQGYTGSTGVGYTGSQGYTGSKGDTGFVGSKGDTGYTGSAGSSTTLYWDLGNQNNPGAVAAIECGDQTRYITNIFDSGGTN